MDLTNPVEIIMCSWVCMLASVCVCVFVFGFIFLDIGFHNNFYFNLSVEMSTTRYSRKRNFGGVREICFNNSLLKAFLFL